MAYLTTTAFDTVYKGAAVVLSGSNLIGTVTSGTGTARSNNRMTSKSYFEMVAGATITGSSSVGVCTGQLVMTGLLGATIEGVGYNKDGTVKINNLTITTIATFTAADNIGVAFDPFNEKVWFRKNGGNWNNDVIGNQNPATNTGGISLATMNKTSFCGAWGGSASASITAKFATASWTYTAPSGFNSMDDISLSTVRSNGFGINTSTPPASIGVNLMKVKTAQTYTAGTINMSGVPGGRVTGVVQESGTPVVGKTVYVIDRLTGQLLGKAVSGVGGVFSIDAAGRSSVVVLSLDSPYNSIVFDNVVPV